MLIGAFAIQSFFIVSGFLYKPKQWWISFSSLFVPLLTISLVFAIILLLCRSFELTDIFNKYTIIPIQVSDVQPFCVGVWFVEVLWIIRLILGDFCWITFFRDHCLSISLFCICVTILLYFLGYKYGLIYAEWVIPTFPFMAFGIILKKYFCKIEKYLNWKTALWMLPLFIISSYLNSNGDECHPYRCSFGVNYGWYLINSVLGFFSLVCIVKELPRFAIIELFSKGTMLILFIHYPFLQFFLKITMSVVPGKLYPISFLIASFFTIILMSIVVYICNRFSPFMLGKTNSIERLLTLKK